MLCYINILLLASWNINNIKVTQNHINDFIIQKRKFYEKYIKLSTSAFNLPLLKFKKLNYILFEKQDRDTLITK
jgi:hypothetical protein